MSKEFQHTYSGGESQCTYCRGWTRGANLKTECPVRLRAEVDRLRSEVIGERSAVVAHLRERAIHGAGNTISVEDACTILADLFESGEHRKEDG